MAGLLRGLLIPKLSPAENAAVIRELNEKKEFDLRKDQISRIGIMSPGLFTTGHMFITPRVRDEAKVRVLNKAAFQRLRDLMQAFYPEAVSLV